jgi:hypothetical protein
MKKKFILILLSFNFLLFSQEKKKIYLLVSDFRNFSLIGNNSGYEFNFYVKSTDNRFKFDNYSFFVLSTDSTLNPLIDYSKIETIKKDEIIKIEDYFKDKSPCESHEDLSYNAIYLLKKIENKSDQYYVFLTSYNGSTKNVLKTIFSRKAKKLFEGME